MKRTELVVFLLVMAIAIVMRLYGLSGTPPGLSTTEALNGNTAIEVRESGSYRLFYPDSNGREGLFINLQALSVRMLGETTTALRMVSALAGILTVMGVYLLTRRMFDDWRMAALASFLMSVGFWHVSFSRIGIQDSLGPLFAVWGFYYLYKGIELHRLWHWALAGVLFGLGFHVSIASRILPAAVGFTLIAFWLSLRAAFSHGKFHFARHQMMGGVATMIGLMILVLLPMATYFYAHPDDLNGRTADSSVWASTQPLQDFVVNGGKVLGMFFFRGDMNWSHNIPGEPMLFWPVAAFFAVGLLHTLWRFVHSWKTRGHPGVVQSLLVSWLCIGLLPSVMTSDGSPDALRALIVAPAVYIIAAIGLHWLYLSMERWYGRTDYHQICVPLRHMPGSWGHRVCVDRSTLVVTIAVLSVLFAVGIGDASRYFVRWAQHPSVRDAFASRSVDVANRLLAMPPATLKYVVVTPEDTLVRGVPMSAQTVMFLTDSWSPEKQRAQNIYYLTKQQFDDATYPKGATVIQLTP